MTIKEYTKGHLLLCATPPTNTSYDVSYCINMDGVAATTFGFKVVYQNDKPDKEEKPPTYVKHH